MEHCICILQFQNFDGIECEWPMFFVFLLLDCKLLVVMYLKETRSVTMNIFWKKKNLFKSLVKIEYSYLFTINMFSTAENCMEK